MTRLGSSKGPAPAGIRRQLPRKERRQQIIDAARHAFARSGFADTMLDEVAAEAGISRMLLYRHFESKAELYQSVLDDASSRLEKAIGGHEAIGADTVPKMIAFAEADPDGFRLLFHFSAREAEFRPYADEQERISVALASERLADRIPDEPTRHWVAHLIASLPVQAVLAWLNANRPIPADQLAVVISMMNGGIVSAVATP